MKIKLNKYHKILIVVLAVIMIGFLALSYYQQFSKESHEFFGVMEGFSDDSITIRGAYMMTGISLFEASKKTNKVIVIIDSETKFIKGMTIVTGPENGYAFSTTKLRVEVKSTEETGSFSEVKGIGGSPAMARFNFRIISKDNIYGRNKIKAEEVRYSIVEERQAK